MHVQRATRASTSVKILPGFQHRHTISAEHTTSHVLVHIMSHSLPRPMSTSYVSAAASSGGVVAGMSSSHLSEPYVWHISNTGPSFSLSRVSQPYLSRVHLTTGHKRERLRSWCFQRDSPRSAYSSAIHCCCYGQASYVRRSSLHAMLS